jgi:hydrogenase nickel incorporation protein HypA/HybF
MHELSIVMSIIDIASAEAAKAGAQAVEEIELDIGTLSTVDMDAFDFAWAQGVKQTLLEHSVKNVNRIEGLARCADCAIDFPVSEIYDPCPVCGGHLVEILRGKELRVKSLVVCGGNEK